MTGRGVIKKIYFQFSTHLQIILYLFFNHSPNPAPNSTPKTLSNYSLNSYPNPAPRPQFEGTPFYPDAGRLWSIVAKYEVSKFYTAPTAIRSLMKFGDEYVKALVVNCPE